ncbi:helix-turn-helix domain-containing protein [Peristeroidobacter soli]|uniref:helix-turn-helix domain-containing protein n=1 Tax=Peristeroidobacter soli TaxID=2497877 RepID=UPI00101CEAA4
MRSFADGADGGAKAEKRADPAKRVGVIIARARRWAGLSQTRLADRLDRCRSYISKIESGARLVEVREFMWIVRRVGDDPLPLLEYLSRDDDFRDLEQPAPPKPRQPTRYGVEPCWCNPKTSSVTQVQLPRSLGRLGHSWKRCSKRSPRTSPRKAVLHDGHGRR